VALLLKVQDPAEGAEQDDPPARLAIGMACARVLTERGREDLLGEKYSFLLPINFDE
jgi:hypothetical protein